MCSAADHMQFMARFLQTAAGFQAFERFLAFELASENAHLWRELQQMRAAVVASANAGDKQASDTALLNQATAIYVGYIELNSPFQANISAELRKQVSTSMEDLKAPVSLTTATTEGNAQRFAFFDRVEAGPSVCCRALHTLCAEVIALMTDPFMRFLQSDAYRALAEQTLSSGRTGSGGIARAYTSGTEGSGARAAGDLPMVV